jgi:hypothetical protein
VSPYVSIFTDPAGPLALLFRTLLDADREAIRNELATAFAPFATNGGYEIPGVMLVSVAS